VKTARAGAAQHQQGEAQQQMMSRQHVYCMVQQ
jgi:hypothetical protein